MSLTTWNPSGWLVDPFMADPFSEMRRLQDRMNRMLSTTQTSEITWRPRVDVKEDDKNLTVTADVPGLNKEDIKIELTNGNLCISGEKSTEKKEEQGNFLKMERHFGKFFRSIPVPQGVTEQSIQAKLDRGVLQVTIPKPTQTIEQGKKILIQ